MICEGPFGDRIAFNSPKFFRRELKSWLRSLHGRELSESLSASEISHPFPKKQLQLVDPWHTSARPDKPCSCSYAAIPHRACRHGA
jgi:hypothetical protein